MGVQAYQPKQQQLGTRNWWSRPALAGQTMAATTLADEQEPDSQGGSVLAADDLGVLEKVFRIGWTVRQLGRLACWTSTFSGSWSAMSSVLQR